MAHTKKIIPGPFHLPWLGWRIQGIKMLSDPLQYFMKVYHRYGPISAWDPGHPMHVCAFGPDLYREIITNPDVFIVDAFREGNLPKGSAMERLSFGLMRLNGEVHHRHRTLMQPAFRTQVVNTYRDKIISVTQAELETWVIGETRQIDHDLMRLITFISMNTMFGLATSHDARRLQLLIKELIKYAASPATLIFPFAIPGTPYHKMLGISDKIEALIRQLIHYKKTQGQSENDVLSILMNSADSEHGSLTEDELISEAYTVLCHESSAATLTWCLFLLDQHPAILNDVVEEMRGVLHGEPPTVEQLSALPLLDRVIKESIRLLPPAGFAVRYTSAACELGGFQLPKDAMIFMSSYVSHRLEHVFEAPLTFNPARWEQMKPTPYEYTAFGAGTHSCMGKHFAMLEIKIILTMLLQRYRPSLVKDSKIDRGMRISFVPKHSMPMQIHLAGAQLTRPSVQGNIHESVCLM